jgi:hypothetical protein
MYVRFAMSVGGNVLDMKRGEEIETVMSTFAEDLLYINVGFAEKLKNDLESERNPVSILLQQASMDWSIKQQVARLGGAPDHAHRIVSLLNLARNSDIRYPATRLFSHQEYGL